MSLIGSLLSLAIIPLRAKVKDPKEVENLAVLAMADELRRTTFALNYWRETGLALIEENERLKRQRDSLAAQIRELANPQLAGYQQAIAGRQAQLAQNAYNQGPYQQQASGLQNAYCNCVPARADAFKGCLSGD